MTSRLLPADLLRLGAVGLRTRRLRAVLSALGIAIGIASMVAVLGLSESSRAGLLHQLDRLGTNLLTAAPGRRSAATTRRCPRARAQALRRLGGVQRVDSVRALDATVRRSDRIDPEETGGIAVDAADPGLLETLGGSMRPRALPQRGDEPHALGRPGRGRRAAAGHRSPGRAGLHRRALVDRGRGHGADRARPRARPRGADGLRRRRARARRRALGEHRVPARRPVGRRARARPAPRRANPEHPEEVDVSRPSDALAARAQADDALTGLFLGLGAVALLVGGIGIANTMVISVLERRSEIGLRRALGATRGHVRAQFLVESLLLAAAGGLAGIAVGALVTGAYASARGWTAVVPPQALAGGLGAALAIGAVAGLYPAGRAARMSPTEALRGA